MYQLYRDRPIITLCIICANIVLSLWCINADPIINNDAVTYLAIAQKLVEGYWDEAFTYYSWPFYSIFIAFLANIFSIEVSTSAYILNASFATLLSLAFVSIVRDLSNNNRAIIIIAALMIILFPSINKYRSYIIRDFGYLACYLWSLYFILQFNKTLNKSHLLGWAVCATLSCLFRFEGVIFLLAVPYFLLIFSDSKRPNRRVILVTSSVMIVSVFIALTGWYLNDKYTALMNMARAAGEDINGPIDFFIANIKQNLDGKALNVTSLLSLFLVNAGDVFYQLLRRMSVIYFMLATYACIFGLGIKNALQKRFWVVYIITNLIILISFSFYNHFLVSRYTLATSLTLLLIVPFAIHTLLIKAKNSGLGTKAIVLLIGLLLAIESIDKLNIENKKAYIKMSGDWISKNIASDASIYSNNKLIIYYADHGADSNLNNSYSFDMLIRNLDFQNLTSYQYVAYSTISSFKLDTIATNRLAEEYGTLIQKIYGYGDQTVLIYQRK